MHDACIIFIETLQVFTDRHSLIHAILCMLLYAYLRYTWYLVRVDTDSSTDPLELLTHNNVFPGEAGGGRQSVCL